MLFGKIKYRKVFLFETFKIYLCMELLKIDRLKLLTVKNYAKIRGFTPQRIYQLEKEGFIKFTEIDGVKFININ